MANKINGNMTEFTKEDLIACLAVLSVLDARKVKNLLNKPITRNIRSKWYIIALILDWIIVIPVVVMCFYGRISHTEIGLRPISLSNNIWFTAIILIICGGMFSVSIYQMISYFVSEKFHEAVKAKLAATANKSHYDAVMAELAIPRSKNEKRLFFLVSLSAGINEEIFFRGFLFFLLQSVFPGTSIVFIILAAGIIFGLVHYYQGLPGIIKSSLMGMLLGCLFFASGSLILGMLLHFFTV